MISPANFTCKEALDLLDDYRRNDIEPHLRVLLTEHLAQCDSCSQELRLRDSLAHRLVTSLPVSTPPDHLSPRVRREISRVTPAGAERRSGQLLPLMLTAAVIIMIGVAMLQMHSAPTLQRSTDLASARPAAESSFEQSAKIQRTLSAPATAQEMKKEVPVNTRALSQDHASEATPTAPTVERSESGARDLKLNQFSRKAAPPPDAAAAPVTAKSSASAARAAATAGFAAPSAHALPGLSAFANAATTAAAESQTTATATTATANSATDTSAPTLPAP